MDPGLYHRLAMQRASRAGAITSPSPEQQENAEEKSINLLKSWLSYSQLIQFEQHGYFDVVGSHTKRLYRITRRCYNNNVTEITNSGNIIRTLCFTAYDNDFVYPLGDRLLAQKIALENNEKKTLKIANISGRTPWTWFKRKLRRFL